jgi:hypothetical protein
MSAVVQWFRARPFRAVAAAVVVVAVAVVVAIAGLNAGRSGAQDGSDGEVGACVYALTKASGWEMSPAEAAIRCS